jgi:hypothetical protein
MALITDLIENPKDWCDCTLKASPQTVWSNTVFDSLYAYKHATTGTDTIMINTDNLPCPSYVDRNYNTVVINNPYQPIKYTIENPNKESKDKESEDKEVTETKKQPRMFYNANTYGRQFRTIKYGTSIKNSCYIMPEISDVRHITNKNNVIGVEIKFADNTKQKAICSPNDTFNLEQGISICLFKKILEDGFVASNFLCKGHGTGIYNKLVNHAIKVMERRIKAEKEAEKKEAENKAKEQRFIEKKRRADERKAKRESEQRINEMAEAIRRSGIVPTNFTDDGK